MPMDAVFLHGLTQELTQSLTGASIDNEDVQKIHTLGDIKAYIAAKMG